MSNIRETIKRSDFRKLHAHEVKQTITVSVDGYNWSDDDSKAIYNAIKAGDHYEQASLAYEIIERYCEANEIKWGVMDNPRVTIYDNKNGGHAVVSADIMAAIGSEFEFAASCTEILLENHKERRATK